ncbi:LHFPL tetraspan subfamily member 2 protein isoform X2 [Neopsephotus bourkii]|uniref:LHFPL tetraspan subfamily member 2 protein isoform X2 n=1 Tax=Neopsephotus bourkii TaxID=309878 RepID=UPI002AA5358E|nr:LHFPL tetraspan subfamily member 2 protein isoform X2 [Neopsephotus bourkii]
MRGLQLSGLFAGALPWASRCHGCGAGREHTNPTLRGAGCPRRLSAGPRAARTGLPPPACLRLGPGHRHPSAAVGVSAGDVSVRGPDLGRAGRPRPIPPRPSPRLPFSGWGRPGWRSPGSYSSSLSAWSWRERRRVSPAGRGPEAATGAKPQREGTATARPRCFQASELVDQDLRIWNSGSWLALEDEGCASALGNYWDKPR